MAVGDVEGQWEEYRDGWVFRPTWTDEDAAAAQAEMDAWAAWREGRQMLRVYWDEQDSEWRCRCPVYARHGICRHLTRYRPTVLITFCDEWRDCF